MNRIEPEPPFQTALETLTLPQGELRLTCRACPEQYDAVNHDGTMAGYVRLRHGYLAVEVPDCDGELVYEHEWNDPADSYKGQFDSDEERRHHMFIAICRIWPDPEEPT